MFRQAAHATLQAIYVLAFGMGLSQAFGIPSGSSMLPRVIAPEHLQAAMSRSAHRTIC